MPELMKALLACLRGHRFSYRSEVHLHELVEAVLGRQGIPHEREVRLSPRDRVDFMVGDQSAPRIALEVKVDSTGNTVLRQVARYAQHEAVSELVLMTNRARHLHIPETLNGKPVYIVFTEAQI